MPGLSPLSDSRRLAALLGPALMAVTASEALNFRIFAHNTASVVYLNGTFLFVAGLAIVRAHNRWAWNWSVTITFLGWLLAALGLWRMFLPEAQLSAPIVAAFPAIALLFAIGCFLTFKGFVRAAG